MHTEIFLASLGIIVLLEGALFFFFPKETKKLAQKILKNTRAFGLVEIIIGVLLLASAYILKFFGDFHF